MNNRHGVENGFKKEHFDREHRDLKDAPMGIILRHAEHTHDMHVRERLDSCGITKAFGPFLMTISKNEGSTQAEIADKMHFTAATVSVTLQKMLDSGYITKIADDSDSRQVRIYLTEKGKEKSQEMHSIFRELEEKLVEPLTEEEKTELRRLLLKITERK
ncbi:MAG: MarR family transcriptional regulator [Clostridia bacterium]|nr:MarR family transcriptional regulator [Clostridia bacterium]